MSKKHEQRTRAEILEKRLRPIEEYRVIKRVSVLGSLPHYVSQTTSSEKLRERFDSSKYMPHTGQKQKKKLQIVSHRNY